LIRICPAVSSFSVPVKAVEARFGLPGTGSCVAVFVETKAKVPAPAIAVTGVAALKRYSARVPASVTFTVPDAKFALVKR